MLRNIIGPSLDSKNGNVCLHLSFRLLTILTLPAERRRFLNDKKGTKKENLDQVLTQKWQFLDQVLTLQRVYIYIYMPTDGPCAYIFCLFGGIFSIALHLYVHMLR